MKRSHVIVFFATLALGLILGTTLVAVYASNQEQQAPQRWEYQAIICFGGLWGGTAGGDAMVLSYAAGEGAENIGTGKGPGSCTAIMDELGRQGWELVTVVGTSDFYFKRPISK